MTSTVRTPWWRDSVVYQVYVRSFADSDGDGVGDLDGIAAHLDYLERLGVDAVWLNPCYPSPNHDGGYDVSDYLGIDERYGGLPAFERLLSAAHARGIRVLLDLVPNHCSDEHPWFRAALAAGPGSPERARFHFRDGRGADGEQPPNNWRSTFGGPAWTRVTGPDGTGEQWYLHSFDTSQPDFNWSHPDVPAMFDDVLRTWFDRGVDGMRIDVAYAMVKHPDLPDLDDPSAANPYAWNQPGVHDIFTRWRALADSYADRDLPLVGEVWLAPADSAAYLNPGRLHQVFAFHLTIQPWRASAFRRAIAATLEHVPEGGGVPTWTLNNHDVHRSVTRYGLVEPEAGGEGNAHVMRIRRRGRVDVELGVRRARAAALLLLALPGSVYLYQGEELGLPEVQDLPDEARQDPIWQRSGHTEHGRDGCRVPLPWSADGVNFGFSPAGAAAAWLPQPQWFADFAAATQERDPASTLATYRQAVRTRRDVFQGPLGWLDTGRADVVAFTRGSGVCVTVFGAQPFDVPASWGDVVLRSDAGFGSTVPGGVTAWLTAARQPA